MERIAHQTLVHHASRHVFRQTLIPLDMMIALWHWQSDGLVLHHYVVLTEPETLDRSAATPQLVLESRGATEEAPKGGLEPNTSGWSVGLPMFTHGPTRHTAFASLILHCWPRNYVLLGPTQKSTQSEGLCHICSRQQFLVWKEVAFP
jgi:hypothetical protein